jgi:hypothetical protein
MNIIQYLAQVYLLSIMNFRKQNLTKERGQNAQYNKVLLPDNKISEQYLISYLLTYSMEHSPSWEANQ